jgi:ferredoxin-NADP reductase
MRPGIWQEFDGYDDIAAEIEVSRRINPAYVAAREAIAQYVDRLHPKELRLRVADIITETDSAKTLRLVAEEGYLPPFQAGQYICLFLEAGGIRTARPYSISSQPNQRGYYDITVKRVADGLVSNHLLDDLRRGHALVSSGPAGNFYFNPLIHRKSMVCLAGGSGITPFMSMIRQIVECGLDRSVHLFYGNQSLEDAIFHAELMDLSGRFEQFQYTPVIETPTVTYTGACGFMTGELIRDLVGHVDDKSFFICGPGGMYDFCLPELEGLGIPRRRIRREMYGAPENIWEYEGWPEGLDRDHLFTIQLPDGRTVNAAAGESVLMALEKHGVVVPSLCRSGECSMCRIKLTAGSVFQPPGVPVRKSDRRYGWVHSCTAYPISDLEVLV